MGTDFQILGGSGLLCHPRYHAIRQQVMGGVRFLTVEVSNLGEHAPLHVLLPDSVPFVRQSWPPLEQPFVPSLM